MRLDNITIEVIGCFVWAFGETKPHKEALKALKFKWHSKKLCWYLAPDNYRPKSRKEYNMDDIRTMYGTNGAAHSSGTTKLTNKEK